MHRKLLAITAGALTGFLLVGAITLLPALASSRVAPATDGAIVYVDDDTCPAAGSGTDVDPYCRIQDALDTVAEGGEVRVAAGTYTGSQMVVDTRTGYTYTQVVFVDKDLTLRGGYDAADWAADPDPVANPTVIDAQRSGRGVSIVGTVSDNPLVTLDGFTITGGDYTGLHNAAEYYYDRGGGLYARRSGLSLLNCTVVDNIGGRHKHSEGGGIYIQEIYNEVLIENTSVISNSTPGSSGYGAGIFISGAYAPITITRSVIQDNHASHAFAAIALYSGDAPLTFTETDVRGNRTETHGIVYLQLSTDAVLSMDRVRFLDNQASSSDAALDLYATGQNPRARLTNLLFAGNRLDSMGDSDKLVHVDNYATDLNLSLAHVTAADNRVPTFLYVETGGTDHSATVALSNTLLVSFTNAFVGDQGGTGDVVIQHTHTLTEQVENLHVALEGYPTFVAANPVSGDAELDGSYHLRPSSDAIDAGVDAGVTIDIDGDSRVEYAPPDIGADEFTTYRVLLPLVKRSE